MRSAILLLFITLINLTISGADAGVSIWHRYEIAFESAVEYPEPLYDVASFYALFRAPSGRSVRINGFWDGEKQWKIRFMPDEQGSWTYETHCSDSGNGGLHGRKGTFRCTVPSGEHDIYIRGRITRETGSYHLQHADGTPFFWQGCTAWNGGLKSTGSEWEHYLKQRSGHGYNVIQLVATQWRGCDKNSQGEVAFTGCGRIKINPSFFQSFDEKMDRINVHGHVAGLVLLWALPRGMGRELSPGYYLPDQEAILLARYIVARYGAHHVVWFLGGDGKYFDELEDRWKFIGRQVFRDDPPGLVTLHPHGRSWVGEIYSGEDWYDIDGYQSSHSTRESNVRFINRTVAGGWNRNPPRPVINLEPCYEEIRNVIFEDDVRNACYWSLFAAPPSGITYGADGIWPWLREGEWPLNHRRSDEVSTWDRSIELPGSIQIGYLGEFMRSHVWWDLLPAQDLLLLQPGEKNYRHHLSVLKSKDHQKILVYFPQKLDLKMLLPPGRRYHASWFDPVEGRYHRALLGKDHFADAGNEPASGPGNETGADSGPAGRVLQIKSPFEKDAVLVLTGAE